MVNLLVSMCIVLILMLLSVGMWGPSVTGKGGQKKQSAPARAIDRAEEADCTSRLYSARTSASAGGILGDPEQSGPPQRRDLGSEEELTCPLSGLPFVYDPAQYNNGKYGLSCPYPKHQSL
jgi:hypothetical protein